MSQKSHRHALRIKVATTELWSGCAPDSCLKTSDRSCRSRSYFYNLRWTPSFPRVGAVTFLDWTSGRCWPKTILRVFSPFRFWLSARLDQLPSFHPARPDCILLLRPWSKGRLTCSLLLCHLFSPGQAVFGFTSSYSPTIYKGIPTGDIESTAMVFTCF